MQKVAYSFRKIENIYTPEFKFFFNANYMCETQIFALVDDAYPLFSVKFFVKYSEK